jgi:virginiamycin A acetyltransferase
LTRLHDSALAHPLIMPNGKADQATYHLAACLNHPNIHVGRWTYYNDSDCPVDPAIVLAPYLYPGAPEHLHIGRFCQIAKGVQFITATANHPMEGLSTYPFAIFDQSRFGSYRASLPRGEDTVVGHDCWIGREAVILPGARLGNGVIVSARAVVRGAVPDYAIVAGNPARIVKMRFSDKDIARLSALKWWDWKACRIEAAIPHIEAGDLDALEALT